MVRDLDDLFPWSSAELMAADTQLDMEMIDRWSAGLDSSMSKVGCILCRRYR